MEAANSSSFKKYRRVLLQALAIFLVGALLAALSYYFLNRPLNNLLSLFFLSAAWITAGIFSIRFYKKEVEKGLLVLENPQD